MSEKWNVPTRERDQLGKPAMTTNITQDRVRGGHSLHDEEKPELCPGNRHAHWRTVRCDGGEVDVIECYRCGQQKTTRCNFDEDYS